MADSDANEAVAKRIANLPTDKRELVQRLLTARKKGNLTSIPKRAISGPTPLSLVQQRLWFLDQLAPGNPFYIVDNAIRLNFEVDVAALERAICEIMRRHEMLRTSFQMVADEPVQVISQDVHLCIPVVDLRSLPKQGREEQTLQLAHEEARKPFDLQTGPLVRTTLLHVGSADYVFLLTMHHIVADGWSMNIFYQELVTLYEAFSNREPSPLSELPIQYADFAVWQRHLLQGETREQQVAFWRRQLDGVPPLELPTDHKRPATQSFAGASRPLGLSESLTTRLREMARHEGVTLFMLTLTAFKVLLFRYSGQDDISVGAPIANRNRPEIEGLIGFFVNTLVMRTKLDGDLTFRTVLHRVRETALGAYGHGDLPFEMLVEELQPDRDLSRNPLFQIIFQVYSDTNKSGYDVSTPTGLEIERTTAVFDLSFHIMDSPDGIKGLLEFSLDLFEASTITRMLRHFVMILESVTDNPDLRISELSLQTESEQTAILSQWQGVRLPFSIDRRVHELVEEQAVLRPDSIAVADEYFNVSYDELNCRANRLARCLGSMDVGPATLVCLCLDRCINAAVAQLAILKVGAAFVPLDPTYPRFRLANMVEKTNAPVLLTEERFLGRLPDTGSTIICLDRDERDLELLADDNLAVRTGPDELAYVIFTSGSTGSPRGVEITHAGLSNLVRWHMKEYAVNPSDRATLLAGPGFDASIWELWPYLCAGASVHVVPAHLRLSSGSLIEWMEKQRITFTFLPTPLAEAVLAEPDLHGLTLRAMLTGGDRLRASPPLQLSFPLVNHYGPTENSVVATCGKVDPGTSKLPSIGRPIANVCTYVLDRFGGLAPVGVPGELCIGGVGLARGYLDEPELTREKFISATFITGSPRIYRTGDRVRYLPNGSLQFLERMDQQVKLRGYRIELGEIETTLNTYPSVLNSVIALVKDPGDEDRLVAYVVIQAPDSRSDQAQSVKALEYEQSAALRKHLRQTLPEYMTPSAYVYVNSLPLTHNGKVDRDCLPEPVWGGGQHPYAPPSTPAEERIAEIWAEILSVERIGVNDNFFNHLGGHSLLATRVVSRIRENYQVDIPLRRFFEAPTVAEIALVVEELLIDELEAMVEI